MCLSHFAAARKQAEQSVNCKHLYSKLSNLNRTAVTRITNPTFHTISLICLIAARASVAVVN